MGSGVGNQYSGDCDLVQVAVAGESVTDGGM